MKLGISDLPEDMIRQRLACVCVGLVWPVLSILSHGVKTTKAGPGQLERATSLLMGGAQPPDGDSGRCLIQESVP